MAESPRPRRGRCHARGKTLLDDGAIYDPRTDRWQPIGHTGAPPAARWNHTAVFTGQDGYEAAGARLLTARATG